ncbi:putative nucleotidyl transferase [Halobacteriovorax marinus SJ]|uniref:Nucleotidyl transferase n=1 Tax=Halobacteriovorax marinus (strain ATCC BAA-682 / DSM 15412 / SJ) TaxID=862908 RepID=E1X162_HALMS|nr:sugar phosphate nucleotidyltransferase [Halobacteriovorax marinus]CBW28132.1 putative nucleotidyl transferase [Halobacteriovorax marinus SJ]
MSLDTAYILGAGLGTRMGPVGEKLPKLLWPVYEKSLLELQLSYALKLGIKKVYLNTHFQAQVIQDFVHKHDVDVEILHEEELLDIGGAVHNLANKLNYRGKILILNGDQFLMFVEKQFKEFVDISQKYVATLMGLEVSDQYNELVLNDNLLAGIESSKSNSKYYTYSGVSIINLDLLKPVAGKTKFFESVANFKNDEIYVYRPTDYEYWDFGTTARYLNSMREVMLSKESRFYKFLLDSKAIDQSKLLPNNCYNAKGEEFSINLTDTPSQPGFGNIVFDGQDSLFEKENVVVMGESISKV